MIDFLVFLWLFVCLFVYLFIYLFVFRSVSFVSLTEANVNLQSNLQSSQEAFHRELSALRRAQEQSAVVQSALKFELASQQEHESKMRAEMEEQFAKRTEEWKSHYGEMADQVTAKFRSTKGLLLIFLSVSSFIVSLQSSWYRDTRSSS